MGAEPIIEAMKNGAQVILAGRCSDSAIFTAPAIMAGYPKAQAWHLGKIIECGASVALPKIGNDCMLGELFKGENYFTVSTTNDIKTCPRIRVAAHTLYENPDPYYLYEPSGMLDTSGCIYEQIDPQKVKVIDSKFVPGETYTVKLEGVALAGYKTITIGGVRDPILIKSIDAYIMELRKNLGKRIKMIGLEDKKYNIKFRLYGKNGVMEEKEFIDHPEPRELGVVIDVVAETQETAHIILSLARHLFLHSDYKNRFCISGNFALPYSPSDIDTGPVYRFNVWHLLEIDDPLEAFKTDYSEISYGNQ